MAKYVCKRCQPEEFNTAQTTPIWMLTCEGCNRRFALGLNAVLASWESAVFPMDNGSKLEGALGSSALPDLIGLTDGCTGFEEYNENNSTSRQETHEHATRKLKDVLVEGTRRLWSCRECSKVNVYLSPTDRTPLPDEVGSSETRELYEWLYNEFSTLVGKAREFPFISSARMQDFERYVDLTRSDLSHEILAAAKHQEICHLRYPDFGTGNFVLVSVLPWGTIQTRKELKKLGTDSRLGYVELLTEEILNSWPHKKLGFWFHMIFCLGSEQCNSHIALGDYGGYPTAQRQDTVYPFDLLNDEERRILDL